VRASRAEYAAVDVLEDSRCDFAMYDDDLGHAYNQDAFHYFLGVEQRRAQAAGRPLLILLLGVEPRRGAAHIDIPTARKLFGVMLRSLRDTDVIGWYRDGDVIGGVLTQHRGPSPVDLAEVVRTRLSKRFEHELPPDMTARLRLQLYAVTPEADDRSK
jgi:hypothetical protein